MGVLEALRDMDLSSPSDVSLVGFDDVPFAGLLSPPLTSIRQPVRQMGVRGVDALMAMIRGEATEPDPIRLPVELIARDSVGPPANGDRGAKPQRRGQTLAQRQRLRNVTG